MKETKFEIRNYEDPARPSLKYYVTGPKINGKRWRRFFETKKEAQTCLELKKAEIQNYGKRAFEISDSLRVEALDCDRRLREAGATLAIATGFYLRHAKPKGGVRTCMEATSELIAAKKASGKRESYLKGLGWSLGVFNRSFSEQKLNEIRRPVIEEWLDSMPFKLATRRAYIRDVGIL